MQWLDIVVLSLLIDRHVSREDGLNYQISMMINTTFGGNLNVMKTIPHVGSFIESNFERYGKDWGMVICHQIHASPHENPIGTFHAVVPRSFINSNERQQRCLRLIDNEAFLIFVQLTISNEICSDETKPSLNSRHDELANYKAFTMVGFQLCKGVTTMWHLSWWNLQAKNATTYSTTSSDNSSDSSTNDLDYYGDLLARLLLKETNFWSSFCKPYTIRGPQCFFREGAVCRRTTEMTLAATDPLALQMCYKPYEVYEDCDERQCVNYCKNAEHWYTNCSADCDGVQFLVIGDGNFTFSNCPEMRVNSSRRCGNRCPLDTEEIGLYLLSVGVATGVCLLLIAVLVVLLLQRRFARREIAEEKALDAFVASQLSQMMAISGADDPAAKIDRSSTNTTGLMTLPTAAPSAGVNRLPTSRSKQPVGMVPVRQQTPPEVSAKATLKVELQTPPKPPTVPQASGIGDGKQTPITQLQQTTKSARLSPKMSTTTKMTEKVSVSPSVKTARTPANDQTIEQADLARLATSTTGGGQTSKSSIKKLSPDSAFAATAIAPASSMTGAGQSTKSMKK